MTGQTSRMLPDLASMQMRDGILLLCQLNVMVVLTSHYCLWNVAAEATILPNDPGLWLWLE